MRKLFTILFCCLVMFGCKKNPFDYRTKYLGNYRFLIHEVDWWAGGGHLDTTYYADGGIDYGYDKNTIAIHWSGLNSAVDPDLFEDASFKGMGASGDFWSTKKVVFEFITGRISYTNTYYITGEKTK